MRYLPIGLEVRLRPCVVVGGGDIGARKALKLVEADARVTVVAPWIHDALARAAESGRLRWVRKRFEEEDLEGAFLVVMATDDPALNATGARVARESGALACDASSAEGSQIIFGALLQTSEGVTVATFSDGRDPVAARDVRDRLARALEGSEGNASS